MNPTNGARPALLRPFPALFLGLAAISFVILAPAKPAVALDDGMWSLIAPPPGTISARSLTGVAFDPVRDRLIVVYGDIGLGSPVSDVWVQALTGLPLWTRIEPAGSGPSPRLGHSLIYQPSQDRLILFGGESNMSVNDVWALSLSGTPTWTQLTPTGSPPAGRFGQDAVYDAARDRMIVFGGHDGTTVRNDVWALSLGPTPAWTQLTPAGTPPAPRQNHACVYDGVRDQLVVFGGWNGFANQFFNDTWALSLAGGGTWSPIVATGTPPSARQNTSMTYDATRGQVVVIDGRTGGVFNDIHVLSLGPSPVWTLVSAGSPGPTARYGHGAVYDAPRDRVVMFGGRDLGQSFNETWALSLASPAWAKLEDTRSAANVPRRLFGMASNGGSMLFFGGEAGGLRDDAGLLNLVQVPFWGAVVPAAKPSARSGHRMIFDPPRNRALIFGGNSGVLLNDVYAFSMTTGSWTALAPSGTPPSPRAYHAMVYDPVRERMLVIGGRPTTSAPFDTAANDVWALRLNGPPEWTALAPTGTPPSPRYLHSAIYQPAQDRVIVFGGYNPFPAYFNDVWALSLSGTPAWTKLVPAGTPPVPRGGSAVIYDNARNRVVVFGGYDGAVAHNDLWELQLRTTTPGWSKLAPAGPVPGIRAYMEGIYDPAWDRMIMMAGFNPPIQVAYGDAWALSFGSPTPALVSLVSARAEPGVARVTWQVADRGGATFSVWRSGAPVGWTAVGDVVPDGDARVSFVDHDVVAGARYGYRLGIREGSTVSNAGEVWVDIPRAPRLALAGARPNPAGRVLTIAYALEDGSPATLELFDTSGRRVIARAVGSEGAGEHEFLVAEANAWPAGVYIARLRQHGRALTSRVAIVR